MMELENHHLANCTVISYSGLDGSPQRDRSYSLEPVDVIFHVTKSLKIERLSRIHRVEGD